MNLASDGLADDSQWSWHLGGVTRTTCGDLAEESAESDMRVFDGRALLFALHTPPFSACTQTGP
jgi:hypothetical protein